MLEGNNSTPFMLLNIDLTVSGPLSSLQFSLFQ